MSRSDYWYAAQVTSGMEFELVEEIERALAPIGRAYCPRMKVKMKVTRHTRNRKEIEKDVPLFSKYLFVKFGSPFQNWGKVTSLKGVDGFIRANGYPLPIRSADIAKIRNEVEAGTYNAKGLEGGLKVGDRIQIDYSDEWTTFSGFSGVFQGLTKHRQAKVELTLFGRATKVEIPTELLVRLL